MNALDRIKFLEQFYLGLVTAAVDVFLRCPAVGEALVGEAEDIIRRYVKGIGKPDD